MSSPKSRLEQIIASVPQNATAARVVSRGEHYEPDIDYRGCWHSAVPPAMVAIDTLHVEARALAARVIGKRFDRLIVIGFAAPIPGYRARWVVRCSCGEYELRSSRFFKRGGRNAAGDWCRQCDHLQNIRYEYDTLGPRPVSDFTQPAAASISENGPAEPGGGAGTYGCLPPVADRQAADNGRPLPSPPPFPRRKNPRQRRAMDARREQGYQQFGSQRLGTLADLWPGESEG